MTLQRTQDQFVEIGVGLDKFALPIQDIQEIIKMQSITEIPNMKPTVLGVINLRGNVIPVVSLRKRLGLPEHMPTKSGRIVIVNFREALVGLVVDQVFQVTSYHDIQPPPIRTSSSLENDLEGIGKTSADLVSIMNIDHILS